MAEKRKSDRLKVSMNLELSSLFKQDNVVVKNVNAPIEVVDISRGGIGFQSANDLPIGFYFNSCIQLGSVDAKLYCVVKIIRQESINENLYRYGCEFVGMAPVLSYIFDDFQKTYIEQEH